MGPARGCSGKGRRWSRSGSRSRRLVWLQLLKRMGLRGVEGVRRSSRKGFLLLRDSV